MKSKYLSIALSVLSFSFIGNLVSADDEASVRVAPRVVKPSSLRVGELFPALKGKSIDGREFNLASAKNKKATVIAMTSTSCPICKKYAATLAEIEKEFKAKGVQFCYLNTLPSDETEDIKSAIKNHGFEGPYIHDKTENWNQSLEIRTTAEVFVFDSAMTLVYRGAVDDQYGLGYSRNKPKRAFLRDALNSVTKGKAVITNATTAPGCEIWTETDSTNKKKPSLSDVTYHNRISRIVQNNCVNCHREQGLAPFSLETAEDLKSHAGMIKYVVENKTMPPWFAAKQPKNTKEQEKIVWSNDKSLSESDKKDLLNWLASERKIGDESDAAIPKTFESKWNIGKPDMSFRIHQTFSIKAKGTMEYQYAYGEKSIKEDTWISAVEIRPSSPEVVHHVLVFLRTPGSREKLDGASGFFAAYVPGNTFQIFPPGFAKKIPAGSKLLFQLHYTPNGTETKDRTEIGLKFYKGKPKHIVRVQGIAERRGLIIPPGAPNHSISKFHGVNDNVKLLAFLPHMHLRGKAFKYELVDLDPKRSVFRRNPKDDEIKKSRVLLDIPRYDFNWQLVYRLAEPIPVSKGQFIKVTGTFDNSEGNPAIDNPRKRVRWGDQTQDEMLIGYVEYYFPNEEVK